MIVLSLPKREDFQKHTLHREHLELASASKKAGGNVFADIGFPNPEREQLMAHLILQICRIINSRRCEIAMNSDIFLSAQLARRRSPGQAFGGEDS